MKICKQNSAIPLNAHGSSNAMPHAYETWIRQHERKHFYLKCLLARRLLHGLATTPAVVVIHWKPRSMRTTSQTQEGDVNWLMNGRISFPLTYLFCPFNPFSIHMYICILSQRYHVELCAESI